MEHRVVVFGAGGAGAYLGARLQAAGAKVLFVARGAQREALASKGLRLRSPRGDLHLPAVEVTEHLEGRAHADLVLVGVKLWALPEACAALRPVVGPETTVVGLQNGVHKDAVLREHLGPRAVLPAVLYIAATLEEPGVVVHTGALQRLALGEADGARSARVEALSERLRAAGFEVETSDAIERTSWQKFVFLVGLSGACSALRASVGLARSHARSRAFLLELLRETAAVGRARGVPLPLDEEERALALIDSLAPAVEPSMLSDLRRGRRLELPWLSGAVCELGAGAGVPTPCNRAVCDVLALYEDGTPSAPQPAA